MGSKDAVSFLLAIHATRLLADVSQILSDGAENSVERDALISWQLPEAL
jgi:hypothetical protein